MRASSKGTRVNSQDMRANSKGMRINSKGTRANSKGTRANSKDMRVSSKGTKANSQYIRANSQDTRANSKGTRASSKGTRANSQDTRANSNTLLGQNQGLMDDSRLIVTHITVITNQILASPSKSMVVDMMPLPLHNPPTHISRVSTSVTPKSDKGPLNPQVLRLRDHLTPDTMKKDGGINKKAILQRHIHPAYSLHPEATRKTMRQESISTAILLHSRVIALRQTRQRKVVMVQQSLPVHMATSGQCTVNTKVITRSSTTNTRALSGHWLMQGNREDPTLGKRGRREEMYNMAVPSLTNQSGSHMTRESTGVNHHMIGQQHQAADHKSTLSQPRTLGTCLQLPQLAKSKGSQR